MNRKTLKVLLPILVLLAGSGGAYALVASRKAPPRQRRKVPPPLVRIQTVHPSTHRLLVRAQGEVVPSRSTTLSAEVGGRILEVSPRVKSGMLVKEGEVLFRLDSRDYEAILANRRALLASARRSLIEIRKEAELAVSEWRGLGHAGDPDPLLAKEPQVKEAEAALAAAEAAVEKARLDVERCEIRSPYEAIVDRRDADLGQIVAPGAPLAEIFALDSAEVVLPVRDEVLAWLELDAALAPPEESITGPEVVLTATFAGALRRWNARIVRVEGRVAARTRMVRLVAEVRNPFSYTVPLRPGLFVRAEIRGKRISGAFLVDRAALIDDSSLYIVDPDGRLRSRKITVLKKNRGTVVVTRGLEDGDRVCLSRLDTVVEGMQVRIDDSRDGAGR